MYNKRNINVYSTKMSSNDYRAASVNMTGNVFALTITEKVNTKGITRNGRIVKVNVVRYNCRFKSSGNKEAKEYIRKHKRVLTSAFKKYLNRHYSITLVGKDNDVAFWLNSAEEIISAIDFFTKLNTIYQTSKNLGLEKNE